jgi:hypothetical protein
VFTVASAVHNRPRGKPIATWIVSPTILPPIKPTGGIPAYIVTTGDVAGVQVRSVATGKVIAAIAPAAKRFLVEGIAAAPGDRIFYLAGEFVKSGGRYLEFFKVVLGQDGKLRRTQRVPGPVIPMPGVISSDGLISIPVAVSPNGEYLAFVSTNTQQLNPGSRPATVTVRNVLTGVSHSWSLWRSSQTSITELSWTAGGQLCLVATVGDATASHGTVIKHHGRELNVIMMLNALNTGTSFAAASRLVSYGSGSFSESEQGVLPGPVAAVVTADGVGIAAQFTHGPQPRRAANSRLVLVSAATGKVTNVVLNGIPASRAQPVTIDGDNLLFTLTLPHVRAHGLYVCGDLADYQLITGHITKLPFPVYCNTVVPSAPFTGSW